MPFLGNDLPRRGEGLQETPIANEFHIGGNGASHRGIKHGDERGAIGERRGGLSRLRTEDQPSTGMSRKSRKRFYGIKRDRREEFAHQRRARGRVWEGDPIEKMSDERSRQLIRILIVAILLGVFDP